MLETVEIAFIKSNAMEEVDHSRRVFLG